MNNPINILRLFRADRRRRDHRLQHIAVRPAANEERRAPAMDRDSAVFWSVMAMVVICFWLSVFGVI